ncbi:ABC transporter substrate-binding protein [Vallitalea okinawensis]|uniref:ABC transporter substrate-binding protein n=1 Tax=Vallitalea okinawensis TaxID=2078660 RepID=UPI00130042B8|nr:extracellular solute-binding protein [Vallitalea okinawensis]
MKIKFKSALAIALASIIGLGAVGCTGASEEKKVDEPTAEVSVVEETEKKEVKDEKEESGLPEAIELDIATFRVGTHNAANAETRYFSEFQEKYNGVDNQKITLKVTEMPSDAEYYNQMKILATANNLPDVFEGNNGVLELAVKNGIAVDMMGYVDADPQYKSELGEGAIAAGRQWEDEGLYNISYGLQAIGYFYNKDMYEQAGIEVPKTWDEWMSNLEVLKSSGVCKAPLSLMTGENGWTSNLILVSMIGTSGEAGNTFMNTRYVDTYNTPEVVDAFGKMQTMLKEYALPDAVGSDYATAANHFLNGETAIIANGPWMTPDFSNTDKAEEGFADKVGVALYPGNGTISQFERGFSIAKSDKAIEDAAFEFIKFKTDAYGQLIHLEEAGVLPLTSNVELSDEFKAKNPLVVDFVGLLSDIEYQYKTIDTISYPTALNALSRLYPELAYDMITPEEMAIQLDEAASKDASYKK